MKNVYIFLGKILQYDKKTLFERKNKQKIVLIFIYMYKNDNKSLKLYKRYDIIYDSGGEVFVFPVAF